jgi:hypothetical protein
VEAWKDLLDAERTRATTAATLDETWSRNFTTSKEDMLKSLDERIEGLRKKLGLAPRDD